MLGAYSYGVGDPHFTESFDLDSTLIQGSCISDDGVRQAHHLNSTGCE